MAVLLLQKNTFGTLFDIVDKCNIDKNKPIKPQNGGVQMESVSMKRVAVTGSEPSRTSPQGNNAKESENESAEQNARLIL